jgi:hypothetical protein
MNDAPGEIAALASAAAGPWSKTDQSTVVLVHCSAKAC